MRLFPEPILVKKYDGFTKDDLFNRTDFGKGLGNLFAQIDDPMTVILDAPWGVGKTTFVKMWSGHMRNNGYPVIYFDAFKHDYIDDAFTALAGEVYAQAQDYYVELEEKREKGELEEAAQGLAERLKEKAPTFLRAAAKFGITFAKEGGKGAIRKISEKIVGAEGTDAVSDAATEFLTTTFTAACETTADNVCDWMDNDFLSDLVVRNEQKKTIKEFQAALEDMASELATLSCVGGGCLTSTKQLPLERTPLIFVIDELDRCKPNFALELLEVVKHFFSTKNVHFLIVTHLEQLENSVRYAYGIKDQAGHYLQKFYDVKVKLPEQIGLVRNSEKYLQKLEDDLGFSEQRAKFSYVQHHEWLREVMKKNSPRTLEKIYTQAALIQIIMPSAYKETFSPVCYLLPILQVLYPEAIARILARKISTAELAEVIGVTINNVIDRRSGMYFWSVWAEVLLDVEYLDFHELDYGENISAYNSFVAILNCFEKYC